MPKVRLEFKLPEEQAEYDVVRQADKYHAALRDIYQFLRADYQYGVGKWEEVYDKFFEILKENEVEL